MLAAHMSKKCRWSRCLTPVVLSLSIACATSEVEVGPETPPVMPAPAPSVRIQLASGYDRFAREPAVGDTFALRATYFDAAGKEVAGRPVTAWSLERPSAYYSLTADGVVIPRKAGDGASFTVVRAVIDSVTGYYSLSYRVLGWVLDSTLDTARQRYDLRARLAGRLPEANPPIARRKGLNSDWDAIFTLRCREQGGLELQLALPAQSNAGDVMVQIAGADVIAERWTPTADGYGLVRAGDARELLARLLAPREFTLSYPTADGRIISGIFPARDVEANADRVAQRCDERTSPATGG